MKLLLLISATLFVFHSVQSQTKMVLTVNGKYDDLLGYAMDPDGTGNKQSISLLGQMLNLTAVLQMAYETGNPINTFLISISGPSPSDSSIIKLTDVTVYSIKSYMSTYANGIFNISSAGNLNTELKCKFMTIFIQQNGPNNGPRKDLTKPIFNTKTTESWETHPDATIKGGGGEIAMEMRKGLGYSTHMEFYEAGDTKKRLASWFGNNTVNLSPGLYDIVVDGKYTIKNVPVEPGKQTRLKMGVFSVDGYGKSTLIENSNHEKFSYAPPFSILLPQGTYYINGNNKTPIVIKDSEVTQL